MVALIWYRIAVSPGFEQRGEPTVNRDVTASVQVLAHGASPHLASSPSSSLSCSGPAADGQQGHGETVANVTNALVVV